MTLPGLIITGASGFVGRHLVQAAARRLPGLRRRAAVAGAERHRRTPEPDVAPGRRRGASADRTRSSGRSREQGGAETVVHLAAHYDFTGVEDPEYWRTNVDRPAPRAGRVCGAAASGTSCSPARCWRAGPRARGAPSPRRARRTAGTSTPSPSARARRMMFEFSDRLHPVIVRFAPLFSDWCEYPPLFMLLEAWLVGRVEPPAALRAGSDGGAVPAHQRRGALPARRAVAARRPEAVRSAAREPATARCRTASCTKRPRWPSPARGRSRCSCRARCAGRRSRLRDLFGARRPVSRPFERPWMAESIDTVMTVDASRTRARLDWAPRRAARDPAAHAVPHREPEDRPADVGRA